MTDRVRDLEYRFDVQGRIFIAQVCCPDLHSAAPVTRSGGPFDVMIVTTSSDNLEEFLSADPTVLADRIIGDIGTRMPVAPPSSVDAFRAEIVAWIQAHRRAVAGE